MSSQDSTRQHFPKSTPDQKQTKRSQHPQQPSTRQPQPDDLKAVHEQEQQVQSTYEEMGNVGEKRGAQVAQDQLARGEVSRQLREMRHGEIQTNPPQRGKSKRRNPQS